MRSQEEILQRVRDVLGELFEIDPQSVTPEAHLYKDLDIDSIDAVDLLDRIRRYTGKKVSADDFRSVKTVADLVTVIHHHLSAD